MSFKLTSLFIILLISNMLVGQNNQRLHVITDRPFYISGDVLRFSVFLPQNFQQITAYFKVAIHDAQGNLKQDYYLSTAGKTNLQGYYFLPFDLPSGWYALSIYQSLKSDDVLVGRVNIPVYNDLTSINIKPTAKTTPAPSTDAPALTSVELQYSQTATYPHVIQVNAQLQKSSSPPKVQVVVTETEVLDKIAKSIRPAYTPNITTGLGLMPIAGDGLMLKGIVTNNAGEGRKVTVLGAYLREQNKFYYATPNQQGKFELKLPDLTGPVHLQFIYHPFSNENIRIKFNTLESQIINDELVYSNELLQYLEQSKQRKKIAQYFKQIQNDPLSQIYPQEVIKLSPDFTYKMKDYEDFRTIGEFCREIAGLLVFKETGGKLKAQTVNPNAKLDGSDQVSGDPLFIINGKLTRDASFVAGLDFKATESLELFYLIPNLRRQFNVAGNDGVVKVTANLPVIELPADDEEDIFTVNALLPPLTTEQKVSGPVLTPVVFWSDIINADAQGKLQFKFNHHDGRGKYRIRAYTHGSDGQLIIGEKDYEIK